MATRTLRKRDNSINYSDTYDNERIISDIKPISNQETSRPKPSEKRKRKDKFVETENQDVQQISATEQPPVQAKAKVRKTAKNEGVNMDVEVSGKKPKSTHKPPKAANKKQKKTQKSKDPIKSGDSVADTTTSPEGKGQRKRDREMDVLKSELEDLRKQLAVERNNFKKLKEVRCTPAEHRNQQLEEALKKLTTKQEQTALQFKDALKQLKERAKTVPQQDFSEVNEQLKSENAEMKRTLLDVQSKAASDVGNAQRQTDRLEKLSDFLQTMSGVHAEPVIEAMAESSSSAPPDKFLCIVSNVELQRSVKFMITVDREKDEFDYQPLQTKFENEEVPEYLRFPCTFGAEDAVGFTINTVQQLFVE